MTEAISATRPEAYPDDCDLHAVPGPSYQSLLDEDRYPVPPHLRLRAPIPEGLAFEIPRDRYLRADIHDAEVSDMWMRVWQMACRVDQIPEIGDSILYQVADRSYIVVRSDEHTIKAFPNTCLHRGRVLRDRDGKIGWLRCPYHAFTWALDGSFVGAPAMWDFDQTAEDLRMPEARVDTWGGFVFINPDPDAGPLAEHLGDIDVHFERCGYTSWSVGLHTGKRVECNWKEIVEGFIESHHVFATHPQAMLGTDPGNCQYDIWPNLARIILPMGRASESLPDRPTEQRTMNGMMGSIKSRQYVTVPEGVSARHHFADLQRARFAAAGLSTDLSDAEMTDLLVYWIFPNLLILGGPRATVMRFLPGRDPHSSTIDVMSLNPKPRKAGKPAPPMRWLAEDETFTGQDDLPGFGLLDQDLSNMPTSHAGMSNLQDRPLILGRYQEATIAYFHTLLYDGWLAGRGM